MKLLLGKTSYMASLKLISQKGWQCTKHAAAQSAAYLSVAEGVVVIQPFDGSVQVLDQLIHHGHGQVLAHHSPQQHHMPVQQFL